MRDLLEMENRVNRVRQSTTFVTPNATSSCMYDECLLRDEQWVNANTAQAGSSRISWVMCTVPVICHSRCVEFVWEGHGSNSSSGRQGIATVHMPDIANRCNDDHCDFVRCRARGLHPLRSRATRCVCDVGSCATFGS